MRVCAYMGATLLSFTSIFFLFFFYFMTDGRERSKDVAFFNVL